MEISAVSIGLIILLIVISFVFFFYRKVIVINSWLLKIAFPIALIVAVTTIIFPATYYNFTETAVAESEIGKQVKYLDTTLTGIDEFKQNISRTIGSIINLGFDPNSTPASPIYPSFVTLISNLFRLVLLGVSILAMIIVTYLRYVFAGVSEAQALRSRIEILEQKLNAATPINNSVN
jgi:hypothetical protein